MNSNEEKAAQEMIDVLLKAGYTYEEMLEADKKVNEWMYE